MEMKRMFVGLLLGPGLLVSADLGLPPDAKAAQSYDGTWTVTHVCKKAPDGALPFTFDYVANVNGGLLDAQFTAPDGATFHIAGHINPDGTSNLAMNGMTGLTEYTVGHPSPGVPFSYNIRGKFTGSLGTGQRADGKRQCSFSFVKQ
jgi:hypothetical protein